MRTLQWVNSEQKVLRTLTVEEKGSDYIYLVRFKETGRIDFVSDLDAYLEAGVDLECLQKIANTTYPVRLEKGCGELRLFENTLSVSEDLAPINDESQKIWRWSAASIFVLAFLFMGILKMVPQTSPTIVEELKQHVVTIIKRKTPPPQPKQDWAGNVKTPTVSSKANPKKAVSRLGALAVLGRLSHGKNRGGVNLGQVKTTAGPGLGGTAGSGGVQTSLYGKGILAAPVGSGHNIKGAGGYGTKGAGGGQDGYGKLSLIGSTGTSLIPLGKEAIINGGLDRDLVAQVIAKNMGQVRFCYEQGLQMNPGLSGRVAVDFTIGANGNVQTAGLKSTTLNSNLVETCILRRLKTWKFPLPEGGVAVRISYPFLLQRVGAG